jgi:hypothetical protein
MNHVLRQSEPHENYAALNVATFYCKMSFFPKDLFMQSNEDYARHYTKYYGGFSESSKYGVNCVA